MRTLLLAIALFASPAALAHDPPAPAVFTARELVEINSLLKRWETAWNTHDPRAWAQLFHEDATWVLWTGGVWKGRAAIEAGISDPFRTVYSNSTQLWRTRPEIRPVASGVVVARMLSTTIGDSRQPGVTIYGNKMLVLTRRDGVWGVLYGQNTRLNDAEIARLLAGEKRP